MILGDFDDLPLYVNKNEKSTTYEGAIGEYDSGGGWFIKSGNLWKVAGLTRGTEHAAISQSWFRENSRPNSPDPDGIDAVRISSYADQINGIISVMVDLTGDYWVDYDDFSVVADHWEDTDCNSLNDWCDGADFEPTDGRVDWDDLDILMNGWLCDQECN